MKRIFSGLLFFTIILFLYAGFTGAVEPKLVEKTISLGDMHSDWDMYIPSLKISPDSTRMAFMARKKNKFSVIENGKKSPILTVSAKTHRSSVRIPSIWPT
jgi:hypothetical protein